MSKYIIIVLLMLVVGCTGESDSMTTDTLPPEIDFTGTWKGDIWGTCASSSFTMHITQTGSTLTGFYITNLMYECSVSGAVSGYDISLALLGITVPGYSGTINGTASDTTASGSFSDNNGDSGSWGADRW